MALMMLYIVQNYNLDIIIGNTIPRLEIPGVNL